MHALYPFDNYFSDADRAYPAAEQWDILKELGYAKAYLSVGLTNAEAWSRLLEVPAQRRRTGLGLAAVYTTVDLALIDKPPAPGAHTVEEMLAVLEPGDTLELALTVGWKKDCSDPRHDETAIAYIRSLLPLARSRGVTFSLYHHLGFWQERIEDCVRIAAKINDPALRVTFCGYHWYACDGTDLIGKLRMAAPWLHLANVCGARRVAPRTFAGSLPATIEPVGDGDFPLADFTRGLREIGYTGAVGFQGYKIGGYPPLNLRRSLEAFRRIEAQD